MKKATSTGKAPTTIEKELSSFKERFMEAMDDDFNTAKVFGFVFDAVRNINRELSKGVITQELQSLFKQFTRDFKEVSDLLGLFGESPQDFLEVIQKTLPKDFSLTQQEIDGYVKKRSGAREAKDWKEADRLRDFLLEKNILLKDTPKGTVWKVKRS